MKVVVLCGGYGSRLGEETTLRPKPLVEIGGQPILWHIMKIYGSAGLKDFVLALGYKAESIKSYFLRYSEINSDFTIDLKSRRVDFETSIDVDWKVSLVDTGVKTLTGGRLKRLESRLRPGGTFMVTYGDGVADVDLDALLRFHRSHGRLATVTAVRPPARFGNLSIANDEVLEFLEKPQASEGWINGGFLVFEPGIFDYLEGDDTVLEGSPMERLAADRQLMAYRHGGFWHSMDTLRDKMALDVLAASPNPPWMTWRR